MSVHAGTILHVGGNNVIDRLQSAGLGDVRLPIETIREIGNELVVDKVPGEADFTFTLESLDVSTELEALLTGKTGTGSASAAAPGFSDPDGTEYKWENCQIINIPSPWKDPATGSGGVVTAGHLVPGYYPTRIRYSFGVTDNASQEVELGGGSFYYADAAPVEQFATGNGSTAAFVTNDAAVGHRKGGPASTDYRFVFGVIVNGKLMIEGVDYTVTGGSISSPAAVTITFAATSIPPSGADIRFAYFTTAAKAYPQACHADALVKPGAVRGRNIQVYLGSGGSKARVPSVQSIELEATVDSEVEREMGSDEIVGRTINGRDCTGTITIRSRDADAFIATLAKVTGVAATEVFGYFNQESIPLTIVVQNPRNTAQALKTLAVDDAIFQPPGTPARVNTPTDFVIRYDSRSGTYSAFKGARP